jgi:hypothetical protein
MDYEKGRQLLEAMLLLNYSSPSWTYNSSSTLLIDFLELFSAT